MKTFLFSLVAATGILLFIASSSSDVKHKNAPRKESNESKTEAIDALQFLSASYAYPNKEVPADAFGKAYDFYKQNFLSQTSKMEMVGSWQNIGPRNCGGRTLCVALSPTDTATIWLGSASGGLWKSTTGGIGLNAWTYVPTGFPVLGVSTIAFMPGSPQTMIIGTGETYAYGISTNGLVDRTTRGTFGIGILKSTDGGNTWSQVLNWNYQQNRGVWDIKFNPLKPTEVYAATTEGIYKSTDGGNTWVNIEAVQMAMNLLIDPVDTNVIYCGVGNLSSPNKGLYKTSNSGSNWSILANGLPSNTRGGRIILAINPLNHKTVLAHICDIFNTVKFYISRDQGANWTARSPQDIASYQGWYAKGLLIKPNDSTKVLAGGVDIYYSSDQANNFAQRSNVNWNTDYSHSDVHDIIANPLNANKIYVATDGGLFRSNDFGVSFYECTSGYVTTQFYIGAVSWQNPNVALAGAQDNYSWQYTGTSSWTSQIGGDGCYAAIDPSNDNNQFGAYQFLNVYKSTDQGANFNTQVISSPSSALGGNSTAFLAPYLICPSDPQTMYAGGDSVIKSTDGGNTWNLVGPNPLDNGNIILSIGVSSTNVDTIFVGTIPSQSGVTHIFRSVNGGATFTNVTGTLPNRYPRRIIVDPSSSKVVYSVFSGFGTGHIFKSTNAGNTWTDISTSLPDVPFHSLAVDPQAPNTIFAGCDLGIFYTNDGGNTWNTFNTGFPEVVMVFDLVVSPSDNTLLAFTHGHGVYKRNLSDAVGVNDIPVSAMQFSVFPNPASEFVNMEFSKQENIQGEISIYDLSGRKIISKTVNGKNKITVDVRTFDAGIYFARMTSGKSSVSRKFVVVR